MHSEVEYFQNIVTTEEKIPNLRNAETRFTNDTVKLLPEQNVEIYTATRKVTENSIA